jgi:hypothetical protein
VTDRDKIRNKIRKVCKAIGIEISRTVRSTNVFNYSFGLLSLASLDFNYCCDFVFVAFFAIVTVRCRRDIIMKNFNLSRAGFKVYCAILVKSFKYCHQFFHECHQSRAHSGGKSNWWQEMSLISHQSLFPPYMKGSFRRPKSTIWGFISLRNKRAMEFNSVNSEIFFRYRPGQFGYQYQHATSSPKWPLFKTV